MPSSELIQKKVNLSTSTANAGKLMEEFIESGSYKDLNVLSAEKDILHKVIYDHLIDHESKRHEIGYNLVAKFIPQRVFEYDYPGLNEYLNNHGLLQKLSKLTSSDFKKNQNLLELFAPYSLTPEFYVKPSFNKLGREIVKVEEPPVSKITLEEAVWWKKDNMTRLRTSQAQYAFLKKQMEICEQLLYEKKVKHKYGSVSRLQKPLNYNCNNILDDRLVKELIGLAKPNVNQLLIYVVKGFIKKSEIESFRKLTDIKLNFVILDLDDEAKMLNRLARR